jgi:hypothetical protein
VRTVTSDRDAALPLSKSVSDLIADYLRLSESAETLWTLRQIFQFCGAARSRAARPFGQPVRKPMLPKMMLPDRTMKPSREDMFVPSPGR